MKQVIARAGKVKVTDMPLPSIGENEVLVKTAFSLISSGTETWTIESTEPISTGELVKDQKMFEKAINLSSKVLHDEGISGLLDYAKFVRNPQVALGYSLSGTVVTIGKNVKDIAAGEKVACAGEGKACHAEFVSVPRNLIVKVPEKVSMQEAAFATVGAIALHGFRVSGSQIGDNVGIIGAGLVGNLMIQVAKAAGCRVVAVDLRSDRLHLASQSGADLTISSDDPMLLQKISAFSNGKGLDRVILCAATSSSEPINLAAKMLRDRGIITVVGRVGMDLDRKEYYQKELEVRMSRSLGPGRYDPIYEEKSIDYPIGYVRWTLNRNMEAFLQLIVDKRINVANLISSTYPIDSADKAYEALDKESKVAVLLSYENSKPDSSVSFIVRETKVVKGRINVALAGPGNFAKEILIPLLRRSGEYRLKWVISSNPLHAKQVAERFRFERFGTNYNDVLDDKEVDLIVITTPNNLHHPMVVQAARAGKVVFVEKPLCIRQEELDEIIKVQRETGAMIIVGFNRRYSPLVLKMKDEMNKLSGPFLLNYRVNADYIPLSRWVQDPEVGGGRVIAECCHFFDLFNFLLDSKSPEIEAVSAGINNSTSVARDNAVFTLKYPDGSVATLLYSSLGNRSMERERLEVFGQGKAFVIDDFKELRLYDGSSVSRLALGHQDKGHMSELMEISRLIHGEQNKVISFSDAVEVTKLTFIADSMLRNLSYKA